MKIWQIVFACSNYMNQYKYEGRKYPLKSINDLQLVQADATSLADRNDDIKYFWYTLTHQSF